jgi:hypothetical protein
MNKGLEYERKIKDLLIKRNLLPMHLQGQLISTGNDAGFKHDKKEFFLEIKNKDAPDYGAKKIVYDPAKKIWKWNETDYMSALFDKIGVLNQINKFEPRKYVKPDALLTQDDKDFDRRSFEKTITLSGTSGANLIHEYYDQKRCYYIQVEGKGFYYLLANQAGINNMQKFLPVVSLRLRAKTHSSDSLHNYSFRVIIVGSRRTIFKSNFDLEDVNRFPPIK